MIAIKTQVELETFILLIAAAFLGTFVAVQKNNAFQNLPVFSIQPITSPKPTPPEPTQKISQISPDGKKTLIMKSTVNKDETKTYTFSAKDMTTNESTEIYTTTLDVGKNMSIPFNTWSPDDKYFFIQESGPTGTTARVFPASGQPFPSGDPFFDVSSLFTARNTGNSYDITTGWASPTLLLINTKKSDGSKGSSYWFEVPSKAIIQLATQF